MITFSALLITLTLVVFAEDAICNARELTELYARDAAGTL